MYTWIGTESLYDGVWEFTECDGYIYDEGTEMERTLTVYRYSDTSAIEYMLEFAGEWGEYWHVNYDYPADCTYFDCVEGGTVTISGNTATWEAALPPLSASDTLYSLINSDFLVFVMDITFSFFILCAVGAVVYLVQSQFR